MEYKKLGPNLEGNASTDYRIGLSIHDSKMAWRYGPLPSGKQPDICNFRNELKKQLPLGRRVIDISGYGVDEDSEIISTQLCLDPKKKVYLN
eukprot:5092208-Ditylum_brightwellii.AAC.1